jgi:xylulose-5-phosphate/fructose-6-phosphate phosphoketolase
MRSTGCQARSLLNRMIKKHDLDLIYITGPGHGGPGLIANAYLEGTYSEVYPNIFPDEEGMKRLFTQFSFPGGVGVMRSSMTGDQRRQ